MDAELLSMNHQMAANHHLRLMAFWSGIPAELADVVAWTLELEQFANANDDVRAYLANTHVSGSRLYTLLEHDATDHQVKRATLRLLGTIFGGSGTIAAYTARDDGNRAMQLVMALLLGEGPAAVRSASAAAIAKMVCSGTAATTACYQGLFLQAAAAQAGIQGLANDMLEELAAEQPPADRGRRWTLTDIALQAIEMMLASADQDVRLAACFLVREVVRAPDSGGSVEGTFVAARNRELLGEGGIPAAMTSIIATDMTMRQAPLFSETFVCLEAIAVLITSHDGVAAAVAFHAVGLGELLLALMRRTYLAAEPQLLMGALNYTLLSIMTQSAAAHADLRPNAAALAMIAYTLHVPEVAHRSLADVEVNDDIREALELIMVLTAKNDGELNLAMVEAGIRGKAGEIAATHDMPTSIRLLAFEVCDALQLAQSVYVAAHTRQQQTVPAVHINPQGAEVANQGHVVSHRHFFVIGACGAVVFVSVYSVLRRLFAANN